MLGTNAIVEITTQLLASDVPKDFCTNTLNFNTGSTAVTVANWQALTDAIKGVWFATSGTAQHYGVNGGKVVAYNRSDAKPRPEKAFSTYTPGSWMTSVAWPRQVCLRVSMYSGRNLKRLRGGIFLPINNQWSPIGERPSTTTMNAAMSLLKAIDAATIALTPSWSLTINSDVLADQNPADHVWVNDTWDTQRRRGPKETQRVTSSLP